MYLVATGAFVETITGSYIIANELLTCIYYAIIALPLFSTTKLSSVRASYMCIEIILVALVINLFSNLILSLKNFKNWIKARLDRTKNKVVPFTLSEYNITTYIEHERADNTNCNSK